MCLSVAVSVQEGGCSVGVRGSARVCCGVCVCLGVTVCLAVGVSLWAGGSFAGGRGLLCACAACGVSVRGGVGALRCAREWRAGARAGGQGASPLPRTQWLG